MENVEKLARSLFICIYSYEQWRIQEKFWRVHGLPRVGYCGAPDEGSRDLLRRGRIFKEKMETFSKVGCLFLLYPFSHMIRKANQNPTRILDYFIQFFISIFSDEEFHFRSPGVCVGGGRKFPSHSTGSLCGRNGTVSTRKNGEMRESWPEMETIENN